MQKAFMQNNPDMESGWWMGRWDYYEWKYFYMEKYITMKGKIS